MKKSALFLALTALMITMGCATSMTSNFSATQTGKSQAPAAAAKAAPAPAAAPAEPAPAASGGSALQASLPYTQPNAPVASQNPNAGPFLTSVERGAAGTAAKPPSPGLTSRADGTMFGPGDQPAAGVGAGMTAAAESNVRQATGRSRKPAETAKPK